MSSFTIRVYGFVMSTNRRLLLSHETYLGQNFTKFPGGGLQYGEGTKAALQREMLEEFQIELTPDRHIYTTDFFVESAFHPGVQVVNIYYLMPEVPENIFPSAGIDGQVLEWLPLGPEVYQKLTFETDRRALQALLNTLKIKQA